MEKAKVIVIFPEENSNNGSRLTKEAARTLFDEFTGSIIVPFLHPLSVHRERGSCNCTVKHGM